MPLLQRSTLKIFTFIIFTTISTNKCFIGQFVVVLHDTAYHTPNDVITRLSDKN